MLRSNDILDALEETARAVFPGGTVYRNLVRQGFERPSCMVEVRRLTMEDAARWLVERTARAKLTLFEPVDDYHDTQVELLGDKLDLLMAHVSGGTLAVGDRHLDVEDVEGECFNDFATLTFTLRWTDDRETGPARAALAEHYTLAASAGETKEEKTYGST